MGMVQCRDGLSFPLEAAGEAVGADLDGDLAAEPRVEGAVYLAHASRAEGTLDAVGSQLRAGVENGVGWVWKVVGGEAGPEGIRGMRSCSRSEETSRRKASSVPAGFGKEGRAAIWLALQSGTKEGFSDLLVALVVHNRGFPHYSWRAWNGGTGHRLCSPFAVRRGTTTTPRSPDRTHFRRDVDRLHLVLEVIHRVQKSCARPRHRSHEAGKDSCTTG